MREINLNDAEVKYVFKPGTDEVIRLYDFGEKSKTFTQKDWVNVIEAITSRSKAEDILRETMQSISG